MNRKAASLSIEMIVVMAIALIVLIVSVTMYMSQQRKGADVLGNCAALGGTCQDAGLCIDSTTTYRPYPLGVCGGTEASKKCCISNDNTPPRTS